MATMNLWNTILGWGRSAWNFVSGVPSEIGNLFGAAMRFGETILQLVVYVVSNPVEAAFIALGSLVDLITGNLTAANNLINRIPSWTAKNQVNPLKALMLRMFRQLRARIAYEFAVLYLYLNQQIHKTRMFARALVSRERRERIAAFRRAEAYTRAQVRAAVQLIERQATGGYDAANRDHASIVVRLLEDIAGRAPEVRSLTTRIITAVLDLALVEDPVARWLATFLLNKVIAHLGVDKAIGTYTAQLIDSLAGASKPKDLRAVIEDIVSRETGLESQWAQFYHDGGAQILQAGLQWKAVTSVVTDAALLAFAAAGTVNPEGTARELSAIIRPVGQRVIADLAGILAKG